MYCDISYAPSNSSRVYGLVFFSAVVTAFVAMTSQNLQMDYASITAELMFEIVQLLQAALDGSDSASVQSLSWTPAASFLPSKVVGKYPPPPPRPHRGHFGFMLHIQSRRS